ncbi:hypothetical protein [Roseibium sp. RKSG952]|uniref:hypothetical protein n=1 Tax=Roseibium sp. RKSG952 TaxID=2529384 RepID=UPI0012BD080F|nr:hypothetical protein [Roseibium sp. RKSG952]MTH96382.1 hypothetical protein [Roseibium sp. RKSG952]
MPRSDVPLQVFVPFKVRKQNGRPKILPPSGLVPDEDLEQEPHVLRAIGIAWDWRRRLEGGEFGAVRDIARKLDVSSRHVNRRLRLAYLAPAVLKRIVYKRETPAVTLLQLTEIALLPWEQQEEKVFG